jgi:hypothetical protein
MQSKRQRPLDVSTLVLGKRKMVDEWLEEALDDVFNAERALKKARAAVAKKEARFVAQARALDQIATIFSSESQSRPWFLTVGVDDVLIEWISAIHERRPFKDAYIVQQDLIQRIREMLIDARPACLKIAMETAPHRHKKGPSDNPDFLMEEWTAKVGRTDGTSDTFTFPSLTSERALTNHLNDAHDLHLNCKTVPRGNSMFVSKKKIRVDGLALFVRPPSSKGAAAVAASGGNARKPKPQQ